MRRIAEIVGEIEVMAIHRQRVAFDRAPFRIVILRQVVDIARIGQRRIAHPDPCKSHILDDRVAADARIGGDDRLAGDAHALPAAIEGHAVIAAFDGVAFEAAHR